MDDLVCVLEEILDVAAQWYNLGLKLKVRTGRLNSIRAEFNTPEDRLREMLNAWLTTDDNPSWKTVVDALRSRVVGASQLATVLEANHCQTELDVGGHTRTDVFPPSPVSEEKLDLTKHKRLESKCNDDFDSDVALKVKRVRTATEEGIWICPCMHDIHRLMLSFLHQYLSCYPE